MRRYHNTDNLRNPAMYRDVFNLHAEKYQYPAQEYLFQRSRYNTRRQGMLRKNPPTYDNNPITDVRMTDFKTNLINRHRKSDEKPFNEHDSLSDDDMLLTDIKVTRGMGDVDPVTKRKISKHIEPLQGAIDDMSIEKHNNKFLKKMKKRKLVEPHKSNDFDNTNTQMNTKYNENYNHMNNEFVTATNSHFTHKENIGNYEKLSDMHELHKMSTVHVHEPSHKLEESEHRLQEINRDLPETRQPLIGNRDRLSNYPETHNVFPEKRLPLIERQDTQNRFPQSERDLPLKLAAINVKQSTFKRYPEPHRDYQTTGLAPIENNNNVKSAHNQMAPQLDSLLPDLQFNKKPEIFNNMFDHSDSPKEMSITGFAMVGNHNVLKGKPKKHEVKRDFSLSSINDNAILNKINLLKGPTETNIKMLTPPEISLSNNQDILKNIQEHVSSNRPIESHLDLDMDFNDKNDKLRQGNPALLDKNKDNGFHELSNKFSKQGKPKKKLGRNDESDVDFLKAELHFSDNDDELESRGDREDMLRKNSGSKSNWQKCFGKKAHKKCRKACNKAYKTVCRNLKCTSKSKKDLKRECRNSCKHFFGKSANSDESGDSCGSF